MVGIWSRDVAMVTDFEVKLTTPPSFVTLAFQNGSEDRNSDFKILNGNSLCTLCRPMSLVTFGPATQKIIWAEIVTFLTIAKIGLWGQVYRKVLDWSWQNFHIWYICWCEWQIHFAVIQERCYGNQLISGAKNILDWHHLNFCIGVSKPVGLLQRRCMC